jgi:hypothetical protein
MVDEQRASAGVYPIADTREVLQLFEHRRLTGVEANALLASAIVGGAVAAIVSLLVSH